MNRRGFFASLAALVVAPSVRDPVVVKPLPSFLDDYAELLRDARAAMDALHASLQPPAPTLSGYIHQLTAEHHARLNGLQASEPIDRLAQ